MPGKASGFVIDTNVLISAVVFGGKPKELIEKIVREKLKVYTSPQMLSELLDILRKKFHFSEEKIRKLEEQVLNQFRIVYPSKEITMVRDKSDNKVIETALESGSKIIVSGDKDLLTLGRYKKIEVISPSDFLDLISPGD